MSVDEQIDLEQQADFFIALGHDDAAIDLLMAHMRSTGGGSPLPFLKLLEIHRRRGQREAYERTRVRFNQRFNSVAPEWQADPKSGRALDDYPLVIGRIQRAWPAPLDAMAELEAMLFRRGAEAELFDLPAYQEVLFLYQMARDLHQAEQRRRCRQMSMCCCRSAAARRRSLRPKARSCCGPNSTTASRCRSTSTSTHGPRRTVAEPVAPSRAATGALRSSRSTRRARPSRTTSGAAILTCAEPIARSLDLCQAVERQAQRLVALGKAQAHDALLEAGVVEHRQRNRRDADVGGQPTAEGGFVAAR